MSRQQLDTLLWWKFIVSIGIFVNSYLNSFLNTIFQVIVYAHDAIDFTSKFSLIILIKLHYNSYYIFELPFHDARHVWVSFIRHIY